MRLYVLMIVLIGIVLSCKDKITTVNNKKISTENNSNEKRLRLFSEMEVENLSEFDISNFTLVIDSRIENFGFLGGGGGAKVMGFGGFYAEEKMSVYGVIETKEKLYREFSVELKMEGLENHAKNIKGMKVICLGLDKWRIELYAQPIHRGLFKTYDFENVEYTIYKESTNYADVGWAFKDPLPTKEQAKPSGNK